MEKSSQSERRWYTGQSKVPSFSLTEMLVVLVLSSMIVGILYLAWYTVNTYQVSLSSRFRTFDDLNSMLFRLRKDVDRCDIVYPGGEGFVCESDLKHSVRYELDSNFIVRRQADRIDTFHCKPLMANLLFQGKPVNKVTSPVDEIVIDITSNGNDFSFHHLKHYDATSLINFTKSDSLP